MDKLELIKKVKALADNGFGGEKQNAQALLDELMLKYNIKDEDIQEDIIKDFDIKLPKVFNATGLTAQVFYSVVGNKDRGKKGFFSYTPGRKKEYFVSCTAAEYLEFEAKFKFYLFYYKKELERFYEAFVHANRIFPSLDKITKDDIDVEITEEDIKMLELASKLEQHEYRLQIEGGIDGSNT